LILFDGVKRQVVDDVELPRPREGYGIVLRHSDADGSPTSRAGIGRETRQVVIEDAQDQQVVRQCPPRDHRESIEDFADIENVQQGRQQVCRFLQPA